MALKLEGQALVPPTRVGALVFPTRKPTSLILAPILHVSHPQTSSAPRYKESKAAAAWRILTQKKEIKATIIGT